MITNQTQQIAMHTVHVSNNISPTTKRSRRNDVFLLDVGCKLTRLALRMQQQRLKLKFQSNVYVHGIQKYVTGPTKNPKTN